MLTQLISEATKDYNNLSPQNGRIGYNKWTQKYGKMYKRNLRPPRALGIPYKKSCHTCGNNRKENLKCNHCTNIFCKNCQEKMKEEYGIKAFETGCPDCNILCCCGINRTWNCSRTNHCRGCATIQRNIEKNKTSEQIKEHLRKKKEKRENHIPTYKINGQCCATSSKNSRCQYSCQPNSKFCYLEAHNEERIISNARNTKKRKIETLKRQINKCDTYDNNLDNQIKNIVLKKKKLVERKEKFKKKLKEELEKDIIQPIIYNDPFDYNWNYDSEGNRINL